MSPLDASFLHLEDSDRAANLHIGSIVLFEGPPPPQDLITRRLNGRMPLVPRYRQRVELVPFGLERPVWVDDADFNIDYHLRRTALPAPGGRDDLRRLVGRLMSQRLDRTKPLWEIWVVEGLADERWAMVCKVHHCMVDGVSGAEVLSVLMDLSPEMADEAEAAPWQPEPTPSRRELLTGAVRDLTFDQYEQLRLVGAQVRRPMRALRTLGDLLTPLRSLGGVARPVRTPGLTGRISPHREYAWAEAPLDDIKRIRKELGGTVNDVVLAAITGGFRALLDGRGEDVTGQVVRTLIPVSVRTTRDDGAATHDGTFDNRVSAMIADLPVGLDDPVDRLDAIRAQLADLKQARQAVAGEALTALSGFAPPALLALGMRVAARAVQETANVHTVTTNVPGPQLTLWSCGRRMLHAYPYVPIAAPMRIGVAIFSYDGTVTFGITGDREVSADVGVLADGIGTSVADLLAAADGTVRVAGTPRRAAPTEGDTDA